MVDKYRPGMFLTELMRERKEDKWVQKDIPGPGILEHDWGRTPIGAIV